MCMKHNPGCSCCTGAWLYYSTREASSPSKQGKRVVLVGVYGGGLRLSDEFPYSERWVYDHPQDLDFDFLANGHETLYVWDSVGALHVLDARTAKPKGVISEALPNGHTLVNYRESYNSAGKFADPDKAGPHGYTYVTESQSAEYIHRILPDGTRAFPYAQVDPDANLKNGFISGGWKVDDSSFGNNFSNAYVFSKTGDDFYETYETHGYSTTRTEVKVGRTSWNSDGTITIKDVVRSEILESSYNSGLTLGRRGAASVNGDIKYYMFLDSRDFYSPVSSRTTIESNIDGLPHEWSFFGGYGGDGFILKQNAGDTASFFNLRSTWHANSIPLSGHITEFGTWYYASEMPDLPRHVPRSFLPLSISMQGHLYPGWQSPHGAYSENDTALLTFFPGQPKDDYYHLIHRDGERLVDWFPRENGDIPRSGWEWNERTTISIAIPTG